jgi:hypothetical protein
MVTGTCFHAYLLGILLTNTWYLLRCFLAYLFSCLPVFLSISFLIFPAFCVPYAFLTFIFIILDHYRYLFCLVSFFSFIVTKYFFAILISL